LFYISDLSEFVVKIFVGVEYECPRGHRFMCSAPDKVLKTTGSGLVKDNGNKVTSNDMPLYFPCPCRWDITGHDRTFSWTEKNTGYL